MRKTNLNLKRVKFCKKIAYFCVVQIIILALFSNIMYILSQTRNRLQTPYEATIKVDDVEYESYAGSNWCYVFSNSQRYIFTLAYEHSDNGYSNYELYKTLKPGDILKIQYVEDGKRKEIINAELNGNILRSYDSSVRYVDSEERYTVIAFFAVEFFFILFFSVYLIFVTQECKVFKRRKK